jgi:hypothetical protein
VSGITCTDLAEMAALKKRKECTIQTEYSKVSWKWQKNLLLMKMDVEAFAKAAALPVEEILELQKSLLH